MARGRGFRLYHRVQTPWRWLRRGRGRYDAYLRLLVPDGGGAQISSRNPVKKLISWGRRCVSGGLRRRRDDPLLEYEAVPKAPPKGHLVVYVGGGWKEDASPPQRYVVPLIYFNHPLFGELLREAEEEFGHHHPGGITIPCPVARFEGVRTRIAAAAAAGGRRLRRSRS